MSSFGSFYLRNYMLSSETLIYIWIEPYLSISLNKSFIIMVYSSRLPMQLSAYPHVLQEIK